ncbi:PREDICTED: uncharacterized protein LOC105820150 [Propithecus coquereli]|uniref:uncharacterized protein LOC105820150 n=1 Tax=Propithecus coquereli TaxID=379532 RepID=UPI00063F13B6|nr:PREDICTED: uncharacterized protein LOC105820150 [Propithecus coquereli]
MVGFNSKDRRITICVSALWCLPRGLYGNSLWTQRNLHGNPAGVVPPPGCCVLLSATWLPAGPLLPPPASNLQPAACALPPGSLNGTILPVTGERFSVWSSLRSARAVSPGSSRRETFPETRAHTAHPRRPAHPRSHTRAHTQPGRAGATDHFASAGTSCGAVGTNTRCSHSGLSSGRRRRGEKQKPEESCLGTPLLSGRPAASGLPSFTHVPLERMSVWGSTVYPVELWPNLHECFANFQHLTPGTYMRG